MVTTGSLARLMCSVLSSYNLRRTTIISDFVQFVAGAAVTVFGDDLKDAVIIVVQEVEACQRQNGFKHGAMAMDKVIIILVAVHILIEEGLSEQTVDDARKVAAGFFRDVGEEGFLDGHGCFPKLCRGRNRVALCVVPLGCVKNGTRYKG